ncbi:MAG: LolA family protein [Jatrophihabitantaceae bacterium]
MKGPHIAQRHPALRWVVPVAVLAFAAAATVVALTSGSSSSRLAATTPDKLISALRDPRVGGFSGTLLAQMTLDLPVSADTASAGAPMVMLAGAHTMRFWYGGEDRQRVALLSQTSENDVFQVGTDVWQWDSLSRIATHSLVPEAAKAGLGSPISPAPLTIAALTPQELTERTLAAVDTATRVWLTDGGEIADRPTYELVLEPGSGDQTRIASVHIQVDAGEKVPLGVQVYARGQQQPSIDVGFTSVTYRTPAADYFEFSPPSGATVVRGAQPQIIAADQSAAESASDLAVPAIGWSAITEYRTADGKPASMSEPMQAAMQPVSGKWGKGRLLQTPLLCMLVSDDGRVFSGSVDPAALYRVAATAP